MCGGQHSERFLDRIVSSWAVCKLFRYVRMLRAHLLSRRAIQKLVISCTHMYCLRLDRLAACSPVANAYLLPVCPCAAQSPGTGPRGEASPPHPRLTFQLPARELASCDQHLYHWHGIAGYALPWSPLACRLHACFISQLRQLSRQRVAANRPYSSHCMVQSSHLMLLITAASV